MSENEYKISLGVEVDISDIKNQINKTKVDPIKISLDIDNSKKEIQDIKKNLKGIGFKDSSITKIVKDLEKMNLTINKITTSIKKDGNIEISVKGIDKLKNAVSIVR